MQQPTLDGAQLDRLEPIRRHLWGRQQQRRRTRERVGKPVGARWRAMSTRERPSDRGRRRARDDLWTVASEARRARIGAGLSLRAVAKAAGIDHARIWRFERGRFGELTAEDIAATCAVVGLDLRLRTYPGGDPLRDAGQQRLLERLRRRLHPGLRWATEVPLPIAADRRAWDAMITGTGWHVGVEAETVLDDLQALERRLNLKRRDGSEDHLILLVADTRRNRLALAAGPGAFASLPLRTRDVLRRFARAECPAAGGVVIL
jgi:transcriptional regulator with XRE-family HTH domain